MSITKKNGKYYCRFQVNGERHHYLCKGAKDMAAARQAEAIYMVRVEKQQNGVIPQEKEKITLIHLFEYYLKYAETKKSYETSKSRMILIKQFFKNKKYIDDVKAEDIENFKRFLMKRKITQTTVNRYLEVLG